MRIEVDPSGSVENFHKLLEIMDNDSDVKGVIVFACDANGFTPALLDPILTKCSLPLAGGIYPLILHDRDQLETGTVVVGLPYSFKPHILRGLSDFDMNYVNPLVSSFESDEIPSTLLLFVDGLSKRVASFVQSLFEVLGLELTYVGGGAGSLDFQQKPCVLCNEGMLEDAAVMAGLNVSSSIGVKHGWTPICGPFKVTESDHNVLKSLDWKPALDVYKKAICDHSNEIISDINFSTYFKAYPFGMASLFAEPIVRDPAFMDEEGNLVCVGEIPEGLFVEILHGAPDSIIEAARQATEISWEHSYKEPSLSILIDCVSRYLFLEDNYQQELDAVQNDKVPLVGALSLGEIANNGEEYLEFHNKTVVVALLENV